MSTAPDRPPPFYCPACGRKHRADLSALQGAAGAVARVPCARCAAVMSLRIGDDGLPKCEILESPSTADDAGQPAPAVPGGAMASSRTSLSLLAAAVVAAVVSFGVGRLSAPSGTPAAAPDDARVAALEQALAGLRQDVRAATQRADAAEAGARAAREGLDALTGSVQEGMRANGAKVTAIERAQGALGEAFEGVKADYKALNGRIEGNYVNLRGLTKRVDALEGR